MHLQAARCCACRWVASASDASPKPHDRTISPRTCTVRWQDSSLGSILEAQINGVRVHAASVPGNLHKQPADVSFRVCEEHDLLELLDRAFHVRVRSAVTAGKIMAKLG